MKQSKFSASPPHLLRNPICWQIFKPSIVFKISFFSKISSYKRGKVCIKSFKYPICCYSPDLLLFTRFVAFYPICCKTRLVEIFVLKEMQKIGGAVPRGEQAEIAYQSTLYEQFLKCVGGTFFITNEKWKIGVALSLRVEFFLV